MYTVKCRLTKLTTKSVKPSVSKRSAVFGLIPMLLWSHLLEVMLAILNFGLCLPTPPLATSTVTQYDRYLVAWCGCSCGGCGDCRQWEHDLVQWLAVWLV